jgi:putative Holliday junction resolvase
LATPLEFLSTKDPAVKASIQSLCSEYEPTKIYVGLPLNLSGDHSDSTAKALAFSDLLAQLVSCPVELIDERLTTSSASASLSQAGINAKDQRKKIDSQSAVIILESGLAKDRE